jgi:lipopolysaccharide assembly outer membrane protein LptD (OstA)
VRRLGALALVPLFVASAAFAAPEDDSSASTSAASNIAGFSHIHTEKLLFNINSGEFTIPGHFTATREGSDITADHATGNSRQKVLHAEGNVIVHQTPSAAPGAKPSPLTQRPSTLTCDKLDVDGIKKVYYATGNMHFTQEGGREASSDRAVLDDGSHQLHMEGHVHVRNGEQVIDGDVLDYNTQTGDLSANGDVTITAPVETAAPGPPASPGPPKRRKRLI